MGPLKKRGDEFGQPGSTSLSYGRCAEFANATRERPSARANCWMFSQKSCPQLCGTRTRSRWIGSGGLGEWHSTARLELKAVKFAAKGNGTIVSGTILQRDAPTDLVTSVPVYAVTTGKPLLLGRVFADGEESSFHLAAPAGTRRIVLDPNETILTGPK